MTETLPRMKFSRFDEAEVDSRAELAMKAKQKLGYERLARAIAMPDAMMFALRKLGIEPLVKSSVEAYMSEKAKPGPWSGPRRGIKEILGISAAWLTLGPWLTTLMKPEPDFIGICAMAALIVGAIVSVVVGVDGFQRILSRDHRGSRITRRWVAGALKDYDGNIPEFALDRALRIKEAVPNATFYVSRLYEEVESVPRPLPDPFLIVTLGIESYYVDVWDEKEYETRL